MHTTVLATLRGLCTTLRGLCRDGSQNGCCFLNSATRHVISIASCLQRYNKLMGERMDVVVGYSAIDLDGRFST